MHCLFWSFYFLFASLRGTALIKGTRHRSLDTAALEKLNLFSLISMKLLAEIRTKWMVQRKFFVSSLYHHSFIMYSLVKKKSGSSWPTDGQYSFFLLLFGLYCASFLLNERLIMMKSWWDQIMFSNLRQC